MWNDSQCYVMAYIMVPLGNGEGVGDCKPIAVHLKICGTTMMCFRTRSINIGDPSSLRGEEKKLDSSREQQHVSLGACHNLKLADIQPASWVVPRESLWLFWRLFFLYCWLLRVPWRGWQGVGHGLLGLCRTRL